MLKVPAAHEPTTDERTRQKADVELVDPGEPPALRVAMGFPILAVPMGAVGAARVAQVCRRRKQPHRAQRGWLRRAAPSAVGSDAARLARLAVGAGMGAARLFAARRRGGYGESAHVRAAQRRGAARARGRGQRGGAARVISLSRIKDLDLSIHQIW